MRRVFNSFVRGVASLTVILALSMSAAAAPREDRGREPGLIKIIKKFVVKTFGDGLTIPRP